MTPAAMTARSVEAFERIYAQRPVCCAFAPGRVELLGNHTDYNGGYVLSAALELGVAVCAAPLSSGEPLLELWSEEYDEHIGFRLDENTRREGCWSNYPRGVILELRRAGVPIRGTRLGISSNLPIGAGASSSAALELATAEAMYRLYGGRPDDRMEVARLCQHAEAAFVGMPCGLLDQFSSAFGRRNCFLFLDCATLSYALVDASASELRVVIADSGVHHTLVDGQYAELRAACERAAKRLGERLDREVRFLRDVTAAELDRFAGELAPADRRRAQHVVAENDRVLRGTEAIRAGDVASLGQLMFASHASSRDLFGNSTPELDFLVEAAGGLPGCLGAKLTGAGLGGSTVNLVERGCEEKFAAALERAYLGETKRRLRTLITGIGDGASAVDVD